MNNYSFRTKLLGTFSIILLLLLGVGSVGLYCLNLANRYSTKASARKDINVDAEIMKGLIYQTRLNVMRGIHYRDIREKSVADKNVLKTYRDFLVDHISDLGKELDETIRRVSSRLDSANPMDAQDIKACDDMRKLFQTYDAKTTEWANLQDKILDSVADWTAIADDMKESIGQIISKTDETMDQEERTIEVNGKNEPYTHKRLAIREKQLGILLEEIEHCHRLSQEQTNITDHKEFEAFQVKLKASLGKAKESIAKVLSEFQTSDNMENIQIAQASFDKWEKDIETSSKLILQQQILFDDFSGTAQQIVDLTETMIEHANTATAEMSKTLEATVSLANRIIYASIFTAALIGIAMGLYLTGNTTTGIRNAVDCMNTIVAEGKLSHEFTQEELERGDEIGSLTRSVNGMIQTFKTVESLALQLANGNWRSEVQIRSGQDTMNINLASMLEQINDVLTEIQGNVSQVSTGANEVANASQNLSNGAQESAASLEEISASMQEISSQTQANATNASEARQLAESATKAAVDGQDAMKKMITAMDRITNNSQEIQRVIKVIDDIAFQTNLLALNAAVEAARAGVHGKGFAVVAEEVRNLAARSSKAAQETTELISKSTDEIRNGDTVAHQTEEALNAIVEQVDQTSQLVAGIAVASNEQAEGVRQVTLGLQQIDTVTQQNSAAAEESASASSEMSGMAQKLQELVGRFQLRQNSVGKHEKVSNFQHEEQKEYGEPEYEWAETV
ncbi:MAG: methyl-accepting chemotaxis protein [Planctomycetaceae bacterium]|nr:methyl-accepting chemotaxis protein [Planctomycetaceae bacterium]